MSRTSPEGARRPRRERRGQAAPVPATSGEGLTRAQVADLKALRDKRRRQAAGRFLVEGYHVVEEALRSAAPVELLLAGAGWSLSPGGVRMRDLARERGVPLREIPRRTLESLSDAESPQGVLAVVRLPAEAPEPSAAPGAVTVLLDGVQDPGNAGAILRAADAFGCAAVLFGRGSVEPLNAKVLRAAQGSHFHLPAAPAGEAATVAAAARAAGVRVTGTAAAGGTPLWDLKPGGAARLVVFGNEARGISADVLLPGDERVTVPQRGRAESLGVAAAAAVVLAWLRRERTS